MDRFQGSSNKRNGQKHSKNRNRQPSSNMPQQAASSSGMMGMHNQNIIDQDVLTRLLFQLPPDAGVGYSNRMNPQVSTPTYPAFQKPMPSQSNYLFPSFQPPSRPPPGLPHDNPNKQHFPVPPYADIGNGYPNFSIPQTQNKLDMGHPANPSFGLKPGIHPYAPQTKAKPAHIPHANSQPHIQTHSHAQAHAHAQAQAQAHAQAQAQAHAHAHAQVEAQSHINKQGPGAKAVRIPESGEFSLKLGAPLVDSLRKGGKELNALQMRKLKDATHLLQSMQTHKLQPLCLYTASELFEIMASIAETWKNSGKAAWKKRINKIKENARGRKPPRNKLDKQELDEIAKLQELCRKREEWEKREKEKIAEEKRKKMLGGEQKRKHLDFGGKPFLKKPKLE